MALFLNKGLGNGWAIFADLEKAGSDFSSGISAHIGQRRSNECKVKPGLREGISGIFIYGQNQQLCR